MDMMNGNSKKSYCHSDIYDQISNFVNTSLIFKKKKNGFTPFFLKTTFPTFKKKSQLLINKKISFYFYSLKSVYDLEKQENFKINNQQNII